MDAQPQGALGPFQAPQIAEAQRRFWLIVDGMIAALIVVCVVGAWAYVNVRDSLRDVRAAGLASLLEAEVRTLQLWIDEKKGDAQRWAATPTVRDAGARLASAADPARACASAAQRDFRDAIAPFAALEEVALFNLVSRDGRILSSPRREHCGAAVSEPFARELAPVFSGHTLFVRPWDEAERLGAAAAASAPMLVWIEAPVRAPDGTPVAALGFGRVASQRFGQLIRLHEPRTTRDAYAFDGLGRIVTRPRDANASSVRDPTDASKPLTALAQAALAHEQPQGVLLEPYRNYRGAEVVGAWRWLGDAQLAVAVEVEAAEAYAALGHLQRAFVALFVLVLVAMTAAAGTSLWAVRSRLREARRVGTYVIERPIAEGGMSHIYRAHHAYLKRDAAVKILKPHLATDEAVARFRREAQLCSQLSHPNTVEIYDYGTTRDGRWYYAMEYVDGISLEEMVRRYGPMPLARAAHALRQACGSLAEAHARGWVHRDVKPGNVMLCVRGGQHDVVKVVDFGLVKRLEGAQTRDITQYARILGTPVYMAPERLRNPADADARADIYALGAVAYFVLAGRPAFTAETEHDAIYQVVNEPAPRLDVEGVPPALAAVVARCLSKAREERPAAIGEVAEVLDEVARRFPWSEADAAAWWAAHPEARAVAPP